MSRFLHVALIVIVVLGLSTVKVAHLAAQEPPQPQSPASMKTYVEIIPATDVKFEMVPIPGGTFVMGSPATEAKRGKDEDPQHPVQIAPASGPPSAASCCFMS